MPTTLGLSLSICLGIAHEGVAIPHIDHVVSIHVPEDLHVLPPGNFLASIFAGPTKAFGSPHKTAGARLEEPDFAGFEILDLHEGAARTTAATTFATTSSALSGGVTVAGFGQESDGSWIGRIALPLKFSAGQISLGLPVVAHDIDFGFTVGVLAVFALTLLHGKAGLTDLPKERGVAGSSQCKAKASQRIDTKFRSRSGAGRSQGSIVWVGWVRLLSGLEASQKVTGAGWEVAAGLGATGGGYRDCGPGCWGRGLLWRRRQSFVGGGRGSVLGAGSAGRNRLSGHVARSA